MKLLFASLSDLPARRVFESEMDAYGLKEPVAVVSITTKAGPCEYTFGNAGTDLNTVYAKNESGVVFLTDSAALMQVTGNLAAYRDKKVFTVDLLNLASLEYQRGGLPVVSCRRESPTEWYMDYPYTAPARHIELSELVADMMGWIIAGYPDGGTDPAAAGLEPPLETLILTDTKGTTQKLGFGHIDGVNRYVRLGDQDNVVFLYTADTDLSVLSPGALFFVAPFRARIDEVAGFRLEQAAENWAFAYDPATGAASWEYGMLSTEEFIGVFYKFVSMTADGRDTKAAIAGEYPAATLLLNFTNGKTVRLELLPRDAHSYFMRINGADTPYYINAERLLGLLDRISELAAKKLNKSISQI
jgi:hypothetical protein